MDPPLLDSAFAVISKGKKDAADHVRQVCVSKRHPQVLEEIMDILFDTSVDSGIDIANRDVIDWCCWLIAGGRTPDEFGQLVKKYDNASTCGLVWTANFVAYRCRTCGISPCMSLCAECFKKGNHLNHDYNMFRSQAGGACDCGDVNVMREEGFCSQHQRQNSNQRTAPDELLAIAEVMMPRIILRLIQYFREKSEHANPTGNSVIVRDADGYLSMLLKFSMYGAAMHRVLAGALINPQVYKKLTQGGGDQTQLNPYMEKSKELYEAALETLLNPQPPDEYKDCLALQKHIVHCSFLEELMFWNIKYEFPQKLVCLMLNMLPEPDYKEALTHALVLHYSRVSMMLERSGDTEMLSNRVVHMSVQLFSNQRLAMQMVERLNLLNVMILSLKYMMNKSLIPNTLHEPEKNYHSVVDCALQVLKEHCYWPLVSDLNNVLSHRPVALRFMEDDKLLESWFAFLSMFQGMNVNQRETSQHIEFEPSTYYASFSAELEASAYPMWALVSHLNDAAMLPYTKRVISRCLGALHNWLDDINFTCPINKDVYQVSFHLPLHRYLSVFMCQAIRYQGMSLQSIFPQTEMLYLIMFHPLRAQAAFYEIMCGMWIRNGLQIKGQAMTYIQSNFCNSMVDADLYLLQVCATQLPPENFLNTVLSQFHMRQFLSLWNCPSGSRHVMDGELDSPMLESCLLFLATLASTRVNLGENEVQLSELEMVTLLCMGDKTHSQLIELMPDRCGTPQNRDYEALLAEVADYNPPNFEASGNMLQGMYRPKPWIWEKLYDPIHVLLRAVHRRDFQNSMDRYTEHVKHANKYEAVGSPWPPFRTPAPCHPTYESPAVVLRSRVFHALVFIVLHKATLSQDVSDQVVALTVFLLELALQASTSSDKPSQVCQAPRRRGGQHMVTDGDLNSWYDTDCVFTNLRTTINGVVRNPETNIYDSEDSEPGDWETGSLDGRDTPRVAVAGTGATPMIQNSLALAPIEPLALEHLPSDSSSSSSSSSTASSDGRQQQQQLSVMRTRLRRRMNPRDGRRSDGSGPSNDADGGRRWKMLPLQGEERREERREEPPVEDWTLAVVGDMAAVAARVQENIATSSLKRFGPTSTALSTEIVAIGSEMETAVTPATRKSHYKKRPSTENSESVPITVNINESIISLLLKLHSNLSEAPDSFNPADPAPPDDHLIGDGPFFIGRVLRHIMAFDDQCSEHVAAVREQLWSKQSTEGEEEQRAREELDREERRKRARERQQKLMAEFANQQKDFMAKAMETEEDMEWEDEDIAAVSKKEYDCVICSQTTLNTPEKPMGLVVLVQASSVLGHKHEKSDLRLPTTQAEQKILTSSKSLAEDFNERLEVIQGTFSHHSWQLALNLGWEGGVHLQTCGHHLHLSCLKSYLSSLRSQQRQAQSMIDVDSGEYSCPLCRQLANSVLPLAPELGEYDSAVVRSRPLGSDSLIVNEIGNLLRETPVPPPPTPGSLPLSEAMGKAMEDMTNCTFLRFKQKSGVPTAKSLFLFVTSIARTNLELELVQRGGTLVSANELSASSAPKRACIVPLFHVLAMHARLLAHWPIDQVWLQLAIGFTGLGDALAMSNHMNDVPLLLQDPIALLMQFVLLLPLHIDQAYFRCVVQVLYNLLYFQILAHICCRLTDCERRMWRAAFPESRTPQLSELTLEAAMSLMIRVLEPSQIYVNEAECKLESGNGGSSSGSSVSSGGGGGGSSSPAKEMAATPTALFLHRRSVVRVDNLDSNSELLSEQEQSILLNKKAVEKEIQELCLPFLRIAALLKQHIYELSLPEIQSESGEFLPLVYYLELVTEGMDINKFNSAVVLNWPAAEASSDPLPRVPPHDWAQELATVAMKNVTGARALLRGMHKKWQQPRLLGLPQQYDSIFQFYLRQKCKQCNRAPSDATLCLLCGTFVCFNCDFCQQDGVSEVVRHAEDCGAGTAVFLVVTKTCIVVVRGKRACNWGSVYLDSYGEEDRELKRGKPLFLSAERYQLLQQQWLSHRFNHIDRKWLLHGGTL